MRIGLNVSDLTEEQWTRLNLAIPPDYGVPMGGIRVCAIFVRGDQERHVEIGLGAARAILDWLDRTMPGVKAAEVLVPGFQDNRCNEGCPTSPHRHSRRLGAALGLSVGQAAEVDRRLGINLDVHQGTTFQDDDLDRDQDDQRPTLGWDS